MTFYTNVVLPAEADAEIDNGVWISELLVGVSGTLVLDNPSKPRSSHPRFHWASRFVWRVWRPPVSTSRSKRCPKDQTTSISLSFHIEAKVIYPIVSVSTAIERKLPSLRLPFYLWHYWERWGRFQAPSQTVPSKLTHSTSYPSQRYSTHSKQMHRRESGRRQEETLRTPRKRRQCGAFLYLWPPKTVVNGKALLQTTCCSKQA